MGLSCLVKAVTRHVPMLSCIILVSQQYSLMHLFAEKQEFQFICPFKNLQSETEIPGCTSFTTLSSFGLKVEKGSCCPTVRGDNEPVLFCFRLSFKFILRGFVRTPKRTESDRNGTQKYRNGGCFSSFSAFLGRSIIKVPYDNHLNRRGCIR